MRTYRVALHRLQHRIVVKGDWQLEQSRGNGQIAVVEHLFDLDHHGDELIFSDPCTVIHDQHRLHPRAEFDNPGVVSELGLEKAHPTAEVEVKPFVAVVHLMVWATPHMHQGAKHQSASDKSLGIGILNCGHVATNTARGEGPLMLKRRS